MAQFFEEEKQYPDNATRINFVFLAYPFTPPIAQEDYNAVVREIQGEYPVRLWYFLDEVTTQELMRKIWRAILRSDLCIFDISRGNPNVAFELGLAAAIGKRCISASSNERTQLIALGLPGAGGGLNRSTLAPPNVFFRRGETAVLFFFGIDQSLVEVRRVRLAVPVVVQHDGARLHLTPAQASARMGRRRGSAAGRTGR